LSTIQNENHINHISISAMMKQCINATALSLH
jgi:hypothetical protein